MTSQQVDDLIDDQTDEPSPKRMRAHPIPEHLNQKQRDGLACVHCGRQDQPLGPAEAWLSNFSTLYECIDRDACTDL